MTFLLLNQTIHPDVMATGQYLTEVALRLVERGHTVTVVTSARAYDDPTTQFPRHETWRGVHIHRVPSTGFGKAAKWRRAADFASFIALGSLRLATLPRHDAVVALTTPPLISFVGAWLARFWRADFFYWVMDFNPDEAIAAGWLRPGSLAARLLERMSRFSLQRAKKIIALDHFMRDRIVAKGIPANRIAVIPPWSHDTEVKFDPAGRDRFRHQHGLDGKFVIMYSGNHSPVHPLDTLVAAAQTFAADPSIAFCFIGGGSEWRKIQERAGRASVPASPNMEIGDRRSEIAAPLPAPCSLPFVCLPYQPLAGLAASLSAADLHVVVMGDAMVGLVHPCKIYNVLGVGVPVLYIGPRPSHLTELLEPMGVEYPSAIVAHGDVQGVIQAITSLRRSSASRPCEVPPQLRSRFSKETLLPILIAELEKAESRNHR
jgi:glycosyltransferase involved in cell wall biosynthesis